MTLKRPELAWAVSELAKALDEVVGCFAMVLAVQRMAQWRRQLDTRPPDDLAAEREALASSLVANELDPLLRPEDFSNLLHRSVAAWLATGVVTDDLTHGEAIGYLRGLLREHRDGADPTGAVLRVVALSRQRRALVATEQARRELASAYGNRRDAVAALRTALRCLDQCECGYTFIDNRDSHSRERAYTFRRS